jgi:hypothetical protein
LRGLLFIAGQLPAGSHPSGAAESYGDFVTVDDDGHFAPSAGELEHARERVAVLLDIYVIEIDVAFCEILTGRSGVGSPCFAVDQHLGSSTHVALLLWS